MPTAHQPAPLRPDTMMSRAAPDASRPRALFADDRSRYVANQASAAGLHADVVLLSGDKQCGSMCRMCCMYVQYVCAVCMCSLQDNCICAPSEQHARAVHATPFKTSATMHVPTSRVQQRHAFQKAGLL